MKKRTSRLQVIWFFFKQYKLQILVLLILSILVGGLEATSIAAVYPILNAAFDGGFGEGNIVLSLFRGAANLLPVADEFIAFCLLFLLLALLAFAVKLISIRYRLTFAARLVEKNQNEIFSKFMKADYQFFIDHKEGELLYNTASAPRSLSTLIMSTTELIAQAILSISVLLLLISLSWQGTVVVLLLGLVHYFFTRYLAEKVSYGAGRSQMEALTEGNVILNEAISGIKQVKVFATAEDWLRRFSSTIKKHWYHYIRRFTWQQALTPTLILILYLFVGIVAIIIRTIAPNSFDDLIPVFGTFAFAVFRLVPVMGGISNSTMQIMGELPNCEAVYHILGEKMTHIKDGDKELDSFKSEIELDNVTFAYKGRVKVLKDISITFEKGKTTAIVGRSGSGKTTIINLLLRLFDVDQGEVKIDGLNIKQYESVSWLDKIGFVSQDTFIFNDTIKNNITFHSKYPDEEVVTASKYANAHSFITDLPNGYDTFVGDKGMRLSGGQRQRIAVARAMIRNPEILIFDEATNALDNISEAAVQKAIDEISKDHTVIVVAHRLSTIVNADKIIVLGDGQVLEEGTHRELMKNGGAYCELYRSQPV
ncbi:Lipid A export ATP-binding/permease protein MsbA [subsurface metagenome]